MYIHILHACLGVYRCRSVGHFHVVGLGCARAPSLGFFLLSPRCSVPWEKKGSLLRRPLWIVASPIPRTSCSTYAKRPCLPPSKDGRETSPSNGVSNPLFTPHPPSRTHARPRLFESCREAEGEGRGSVPARLDSRGGGLLELYPACSCLIALFILKKPCSSQLRECACACVCVCLCVHLCAYLRKGLVNVFSVPGRGLQFAFFFFPHSAAADKALSSWQCLFFSFSVRLRAATTTTIPTHFFPPPPLFYSFRNFLKEKPLPMQRRHLFVGHSVFSGSTLFLPFPVHTHPDAREELFKQKKKRYSQHGVCVCVSRASARREDGNTYTAAVRPPPLGASASSVRRVFFQFLPCVFVLLVPNTHNKGCMDILRASLHTVLFSLILCPSPPLPDELFCTLLC